MISRIKHIKGIGKYFDCKIGGKQFGVNTVIFGHNTGGKSTFTDILWSYKTGDSSFIEARKTFGYFGSQIVEFVDENNVEIKYPSENWDKGYDNIEIFDTQFINENIFEGSEIKFGNQQKLHSIIIGFKGKQLADEINASQIKFAEITDEKNKRTRYFNQFFKNKISSDNFFKLPKHTDPDKLVNEIKETIRVANNQQKIKVVFDYTDNLLNNILTQTTKETLSQNIETKAELLIEHISNNWSEVNQSKDFLQTGLKLTKPDKENCVFCGQQLSNEAKNLLSVYSSFFSKEYSALKNAIVLAVEKFDKFNPSQIIENLVDKFASVGVEVDFSGINLESLKELKKETYLEFKRKQEDLSYNVNFNSYDNILSAFETIKFKVVGYSAKYLIKGEVNISNLENKIFEIETSKTRHSDEWIKYHQTGIDLENEQEHIKNNREKLRAELNDYSNNLYDIHFDTINKILDILGADFRICEFKPLKKLNGDKERVFQLEFYKTHKILINETVKNRPRFKNTLSESDKRLLAFSFFYSLLLHDVKLEKKIILFDDPFSSFDTNRRKKTVELLSNPFLITPEGEKVEKKFKQLIILTHEKEFFKWIFQTLNNPKALKIVDDGLQNGVKKSTIEDCNVYEEFIEEQNKRDLKIILERVTNNEPINDFESLVVKCIKILESIFTRKYLFELQEQISSRKSVRSFVVKLNELKINNFDKAPKYNQFIMLCDTLNIEKHENTLSNEGQNAISVLNDFLKLIKEI